MSFVLGFNYIAHTINSPRMPSCQISEKLDSVHFCAAELPVIMIYGNHFEYTVSTRAPPLRPLAETAATANM